MEKSNRIITIFIFLFSLFYFASCSSSIFEEANKSYTKVVAKETITRAKAEIGGRR